MSEKENNGSDVMINSKIGAKITNSSAPIVFKMSILNGNDENKQINSKPLSFISMF